MTWVRGKIKALNFHRLIVGRRGDFRWFRLALDCAGCRSFFARLYGVVSGDLTGMAASTQAVVAGRPARAAGEPLNPPVVFSSTYFSQGEPDGGLVYTRVDTETWQPFEVALGLLEGADLPALVYSSGMAAIAATLSLLPDGGAIVLPDHVYQMAGVLVAEGAAKHGWEVRKVDIADTDAVIEAMDGDGFWGWDGRGADNCGVTTNNVQARPADLVWIESPTNPMLEVADLPALIAAAQQRGITTVVDNTFATPLGQQPLKCGADVVVHSVTKYLAGHSDVVLGAVVTNDPALREQLHGYRSLHGAIAGPMEVWLALRGLRTLALRMERAQANAVELAKRLAAHPNVAEVRHPSLPDDVGHERATEQMNGYGAIIGVRAKTANGQTPAQTADAVVAALNLWVPATSLGGVESMIERRRRWPSESVTVPEDYLRLSVGIEDVNDLWADLDQALRKATGASD